MVSFWYVGVLPSDHEDATERPEEAADGEIPRRGGSGLRRRRTVRSHVLFVLCGFSMAVAVLAEGAVCPCFLCAAPRAVSLWAVRMLYTGFCFCLAV